MAKVFKLVVNGRTKFRNNTHWLEKSVTTVHDKPWKLFCRKGITVFKKC